MLRAVFILQVDFSKADVHPLIEIGILAVPCHFKIEVRLHVHFLVHEHENWRFLQVARPLRDRLEEHEPVIPACAAAPVVRDQQIKRIRGEEAVM